MYKVILFFVFVTIVFWLTIHSSPCIVLTNVKPSITEIQGKFRSLLLTYTLYIDCGRGWYGINCNETCGHCRDLDQCSKTNGTCLTGCDAGFQGELCNISMLIFYIANKVKRT